MDSTPPSSMIESFDPILGCLLGVACGDSIGLPYEGLSARRSTAFSRIDRHDLKQRFLFGKGCVSDDTDHNIFCAQSLTIALALHGQARSEPNANELIARQFSRSMRARLRLWFLTLPAGIGLATLKACLKMLLFLPSTSIHSAGNGAAMRAPILGAMLAHDPSLRRTIVDASSLCTHRDPRALDSAQAIASLCAHGAQGRLLNGFSDHATLLRIMTDGARSEEWIQACRDVIALVESNAPLAQAASRFGSRSGVTGFCMHSAPFAIWAFIRHQGAFEPAMADCIRAGGDVDTVCAIAGGLCGSSFGTQNIPAAWIGDLRDYPHSTSFLRALAESAKHPTPHGSALRFQFLLFLRSPFFMATVLAHGFRRLLPPY